MAAGDNQKLKMLYLVKIFSEETDDSHALSLQEIAERLEAYGVNAERKTLYKDFAELEKFGLEILSEQSGRNVLYHLPSAHQLQTLPDVRQAVCDSSIFAVSNPGPLSATTITLALSAR